MQARIWLCNTLGYDWSAFQIEGKVRLRVQSIEVSELPDDGKSIADVL